MTERPLVNFDQLYPGRFLKAGLLLGKQVTLHIKGISMPELESDTGPKRKAVLSFAESDMEMVLCKTNGLSIKAMFGPALADWIGRPITIYQDEWMGEPCIRIWGSPDLPADKSIQIELPKRKPMKRTLHHVPAKASAA